jgi:hypothetical protein
MAELDQLEAELRELGRTLVVAAPRDDLVERVLTRLPAVPRRRRTPWAWLLARRRRLVAVIITVVLLGLGLTPPVRAAVVEWLRIGGVLIRTGPPATGPSPTPQPPPRTGQAVTLEQARSLVSFPVAVPAAMGMPERIAVSDDRRVVSMDWGSGAGQVHLDQFDGRLSWIFLKKPGREPFEVVRVDGRDAVWFATAHEVSYVDRDGRERTEEPRIAGPCLIWERQADGALVTVRLEGNLARSEAIAAAESMG